jgi:hypothetical protein
MELLRRLDHPQFVVSRVAEQHEGERPLVPTRSRRPTLIGAKLLCLTRRSETATTAAAVAGAQSLPDVPPDSIYPHRSARVVDLPQRIEGRATRLRRFPHKLGRRTGGKLCPLHRFLRTHDIVRCDTGQPSTLENIPCLGINGGQATGALR